MTQIPLSPEAVERIQNGEKVTVEHPNLGRSGYNGSITLCRESQADDYAITARQADRR